MIYSNVISINNNSFLLKRGAKFKLNWFSLTFGLLLSVFALLLAVYFVLINNNIAEEYALKNLKSQTAGLKTENQQLLIQLSQIQSPELIEEFARSNNFVEVKDISYIKIQKQVLVVK